MTPQTGENTKPRSAWWGVVGVGLLLNAVFLGVAIMTAWLPRDRFRERVREAFAAGDLGDRDYLAFDARRGNHQYDECLILQLLTNERAPSVAEALGPWLHVRDSTYSGYCRTLRELVVDGADPSQFLASFRYTRYWHGYLPIAALGLSTVKLSAARRALQVLAYGSLLLLLGASFRSRGLVRVVGVSIGTSGLAFWALPYFGQAFAHATGDALIVLGIAVLILTRERMRQHEVFLPFCGAFGALVAYFEFLTGQLPTAAGFLFATSYAIGIGDAARGKSRSAAWRSAIAGIAAFALGAGISVIAKQMLAAVFVGVDTLQVTLDGLQGHMSPAPPGELLPSLLRPFGRLLLSTHVLTYGNGAAGMVLVAVAAIAWGVALIRTARCTRDQRGTDLISDYLALASAAAVVIAWVLLLPTHTLNHAGFMVRMISMPIALGWAALAWSVLACRLTVSPAEKSAGG